MRPRIRMGIGLLSSLFVTLTVFSVLGMTGVFAAAVNSDIAPNPDNSSPNPHVFFMRKSSNFGYNDNLALRAYYNEDVNWSNTSLKIRPGGANIADTWVCQKDAGAQGNKSNAEWRYYLDHYLKVTLKPMGAPSAIYYIPYEKVCQGGQQDHENVLDTNFNNVFFGTYSLPRQKPDLDTLTHRYIVDIIIEYNSGMPENINNTGNTLRFDIKGSQSPKIGMLGSLGNDQYAFPIIGDARWQADDNTQYGVNVPFGLSCDINDTTTARVGLFDADNGGFASWDPAAKVSYRVKEKGTGDYVQFEATSVNGADLSENRTRVTPRDGEVNKASAAASFKPYTNYVMEVRGVINRNIIDIHVPGDTIYGDVDCKQRWNMKGTSSVDRDEVAPGGRVTFTHTLKNDGRDQSDAISSGAYWGKTGVKTSGQPSPSGNASQKYNPDQERSWSNAFTVPFNAQSGWQYCQYIKWEPNTWQDSRPATSNHVCTTVVGPNDQKVVVDAIVSAGGDTETQTSGTLTGRVRVSNFPTLTTAATADGQWGYSEISQKVTATRTTAVKTTEGVGAIQYDTSYACPMFWTPTNPTSAVTCTGAPQVTYSCPYGGTLYGTTCSTSYSATPSYSCPGGGTLSGTRCYKTYPGLTTRAACQGAGHNWSGGSCTDSFNATVTYSCGPGAMYFNGMCYSSYPATVTSTSTPTQPATITQKYNYYCTETGTWTGWTTSTVDWCRDYYTCPGGATAGAGWAFNASEITCNSWQCLYGSPPADTRGVMVQTNPPDCEYRCPSTGARAYFDRNRADMNGSGDRRCFVQPSFTLECRWDTGDVTTDTITSNGDFCLNARTTKSAGGIGSLLCATLTPVRTSGWLPSNPQPGMIYDRTTNSVRQLRTWGWTLNSNQGCNRVVGMPYVKVYGGDVRVGGGVGATSQTCASNNSAAIKTYNNGASEFTGSGTQFAAFSTGFVDRFVSGQFNDLGARPNIGSAPTRLTFANNAGGSGWGGGFGNNAGPCYNYVEKLAANPDDSKVGPTNVNGRSLGVGDKFVQYVKGNAYIGGSITYNNGARTSAAQIPLYVLVVEGDIFIDDSVTQLDGLYVAVPTSSTTGGNIYTCAFVNGASATLPSTTFLSATNNCKRQLVVNGAFAAKQVKFGRDCGSLRWSTTNERTQYFGGTNEQACGNDNHAAEVFNFTPEVWIRSVSGNGDSTKYDSISSMPPVL